MTSVPPQKSDLRQPKEIYQDRPHGYKMEIGNFKTHTSQIDDASGDKAHMKKAHKRSSAALLLIDLQNDFIEGSLAIRSCPSGHEALDVIPVVNKLRAHEYWRKVVWTLDSHPEDHCSFITNASKHPFHEKSPIKPEQAKMFDTVILQGPEKLPEMEQKLWPVHCVEGTWGWKLHKDLKVENEDSFVKKGTNSKVDSYSAFYDNAKLNKTNLHDILRAEGVRDIYLCGLAWDYCVAFTALEGRELGYNVYVVSDGCKGVDNDGIKAMSERMRQAGVKIISSQDLEKSLDEKDHNSDNNNHLEAAHRRRTASSSASSPALAVEESRERGTLSTN